MRDDHGLGFLAASQRGGDEQNQHRCKTNETLHMYLLCGLGELPGGEALRRLDNGGLRSKLKNS
jgi:hypothetical protein